MIDLLTLSAVLAAAPAAEPLPPGAVTRLGTTRWWQPAAVSFNYFLPDGELLTLGTDGRFRVWGRDSGRAVRRFGGAAFSGRRPPSANIGLLNRPPAGYQIAAVSPDGRLAAAARGKSVAVWDVASGKAVVRLGRLPEAVLRIALAPAGGLFVWEGASRSLHVVDLRTGREVRSFGRVPPGRGGAAYIGEFGSLGLSPDGRRLARARTLPVVRAGQEVRQEFTAGVWDVTTGEEIRRFATAKGRREFTSALRVSPDLKWLAVAVDGAAARLLSLGGKAPARRLKIPPGVSPSGPKVIRFRFAPDAKRLLGQIAYTGRLIVWDVATGEPVGSAAGAVANTVGAGPLAVAPGGSPVAAPSRGSAAGDKVRLLDTTTGKVVNGPLGNTASIERVRFVKGGRVLTAAADRRLALWGRDGRPAAGPAVPPVSRSCLTAGGRLLVSFGEGGGVRVTDRAGGTVVRTLPCPVVLAPSDAAAPRALAATPDAAVVAFEIEVLSVDGTRSYSLTVYGKQAPPWWVETGQRAGPLTGLALSPDGKTLAASRGGEVAFRNAATGGAVSRFARDGRNFTDLRFAPNGRALAARAADGSVVVIEVATGRLKRVFAPGPVGGPAVGPPTKFDYRPVVRPVRDAAVGFSPDGRLLAYADRDNTVIVADLLSPGRAARLAGHRGLVRSVDFAPDGKTLVTGSADTTALIWRTPEVRPPAAARRPPQRLWAALTDEDAAKAYGAVTALLAEPGAAVRLLSKKLKPVERPDPAKLKALLRGLDGASFAERRAATAGLVGLGVPALDDLRAALRGRLSAEARSRLRRVVARLEKDAAAAKPGLREVRAVETLEMIGTPEARAVLQKLAGGPTAAPLTGAARAALDRLGG